MNERKEVGEGEREGGGGGVRRHESGTFQGRHESKET